MTIGFLVLIVFLMANYSSANREFSIVYEGCCVKCGDSELKNDRLGTLTETGFARIIQYSEYSKDDQLKLYLLQRRSANAIVKIHRSCQKAVYNDLKHKGTGQSAKSSKVPRCVTRSSVINRF